eukprot:1142329-Pelagomonas_calceolata.AAC.2
MGSGRCAMLKLPGRISPLWTTQMPATSTPTDSCEPELSIGLIKPGVPVETGPLQALKVKC